MSKTKSILIMLLCFALALVSVPAFAQTPPAAQTSGGIIRQETERLRQKRLQEKIETERTQPGEAATGDVVTPDEGPTTLVKKITVEGATLLKAGEISAIVSDYEGKELTLRGMQRIADLLTDEYRKKGYVTSRAYIPPQTIQDGVLIIKVLEGKLGTMDITGNQHFSTALLEKKIGVTPGGIFDYTVLQESLAYINEHPDRLAKAVLVPGAEPGTTDIVLQVEDNYPFHVGFSYDNYGSRYIGNDRYSLRLEHNNITGHDDKLFFKMQLAEADRLVLQQMRYAYPLSRNWEVGGYALFSRTKLGEEFAGLGSKGKAEIYGGYSSYNWIERDNLAVGLNLGFDSKYIYNELLGTQLSRDVLSIAKGGFDVDYIDYWGRTILTTEVSQGIPEFLGALDTKDADASRAGAGGKFTKWAFNLFRLQPAFWETSILLKNSFQMSNNTLTASEQFQIGGATSVRGYPSGEFSGDSGFYSAIEWSIPPYGLSKDLKVPYYNGDVRLYDALRLVLFWDIGYIHNNTPGSGEQEDQTLHAAGFGARMTMAEDCEVRVETGYPLGGPTPSDSDHAHTWVEVHLKF